MNLVSVIVELYRRGKERPTLAILLVCVLVFCYYYYFAQSASGIFKWSEMSVFER